MTKLIALIPARAGSQRVKKKNVRRLAGHPLLAYSVVSAQQSGLFDHIVVSTDAPAIVEVAKYYGAEVPFLRPAEYATTTSPDIEWVRHALENLGGDTEAFAILRPTSPFRNADTLRRAWSDFAGKKNFDSIRAVEMCRQHPGKMWTVDGDKIVPLMAQPDDEIPWHSRQFQDLPKVYVQNSSLEFAWRQTVMDKGSIAGDVVAPFFSEGWEGFSIDYEDDWTMAEHLLQSGEATAASIEVAPFAD